MKCKEFNELLEIILKFFFGLLGYEVIRTLEKGCVTKRTSFRVKVYFIVIRSNFIAFVMK